jgi:drug/metabolite transporter (DMT)-like permease
MFGFRATSFGFTAILMWSLLALLTVATGKVPPFQLAAMTFAVGGAIGIVWMAVTNAWNALRQPLPVWAVGVGGLFGYHALYFTALRLAPPAEAGLISYLWPLLIVLFSGLLPGERLQWHSIVGALLGLIGTIVLFAGKGFAPALVYATGNAVAFC